MFKVQTELIISTNENIVCLIFAGSFTSNEKKRFIDGVPAECNYKSHCAWVNVNCKICDTGK